MRIPLLAGNWKLNKTIEEANSFVNELKPLIADAKGVEVLVCPVFTALAAVKAASGDSAILLGAQDLYWKESGAYTGEVSAPLLKDAGCTHVIIGHSERRGRFGVPEPDLEGDAGRVFGDTDTSVNKKVVAALQHGLVPIICVGETLAERQAGTTDSIVQAQTRAALTGVDTNILGSLVFAYEPVWAIGTGETCAAEEANRVCGVIRATIEALGGSEAAQSVRVQYGGSVKPDNAADLLGREHIDGALVGGASLKADSFAQIVLAAKN
ncbi:MAG: triosephosphate isomerase [Abditibacteriota bacterium]|nr:triosephosphate isomerase [Abditibacteriota bacterium]